MNVARRIRDRQVSHHHQFADLATELFLIKLAHLVHRQRLQAGDCFFNRRKVTDVVWRREPQARRCPDGGPGDR
jgi:hypothetical protein